MRNDKRSSSGKAESLQVVLERCRVAGGADVYKHVGKSHTLVNQVFHDVLGTTITKAIAATRIDEAKRLLRSSLLPLAEVAKLSGFASAEYFTNSFSAAVGQSPAAYRGTKKLCTGGKVAVEFMLRTARSEWRIP